MKEKNISNGLKIILATSSPYRQEAFKDLDLDFITESSDVDEYGANRPDNPENLVKYLSKLKAEAVTKNHSKGIVIGFDSVGYFNGKILEKPKSRDEAYNRLKALSGNKYYFYTGIYMVNLAKNKHISKVIKTEIFVRDLKKNEIDKYLDQDANYNTYSHGYDPLGHYSASFIKSINGSWSSVLKGIPLETIMEMLFEIGYKLE